LRVWKRRGLTLAISVNILARQLQQKYFARNLSALLDKYPDIDAHLLELEILESINSAAPIMQNYWKLGVCFALNNFGNGYSSLTYLRRLPVYTLKIDESFIRDMLEDEDALGIVKGVIGLAVAFQKQVITEGVETIAHGVKLIELDCKLAQNYGIARPMPAYEVPNWLAT
jgi:EAL domain-containing protein (putative c-di-GMP-specific phosphodiesterase class I)